MVRVYKRVTDRCAYSTENLNAAIDAIKGGMSKKRASRQYGIPRTTLIKQMRQIERSNSVCLPQLGRFRRVFTDEYENELVMHVVELQQCFYGIGLIDLRRIAFELAEQNGLAHTFSKSAKMAGEDWAAAFLRRNPELSLRCPEATSMSRLS